MAATRLFVLLVCSWVLVLVDSAPAVRAGDGRGAAAAYEEEDASACLQTHRVAAGPVRYRAAAAQVGHRYGVATIAAYAAEAAAQGVQIVVFPENGLAARRWPAADPGASLCDPSADDEVSQVACIAKKHHIYVVFNTVDTQPCADVDSGLCFRHDEGPAYAFNANMAFDWHGALVAKYYKRSIFGGAAWLTQATPALNAHFNVTGIFMAEFGVKFGMAVCFDLTMMPLLKEYAKQGVRDLAFSNTWDNGEAQQTMASFMAGTSYALDFTIIGASTSTRSSGSGVHSRGKVLASDFRPHCVPLVFGVDPPQSEPAACDALVVADVVSPPAADPGTPPGQPPPAEAAPSPAVDPQPWPRVGDSASCVGVVVLPVVKMLTKGLQTLAKRPDAGVGDFFGPGMSHAAPEVGQLVAGLGLQGACVHLQSPGQGAWTATLSSPDGAAECSVTAEVEAAAPDGDGATYLLRAYSGQAFVSSTPCPISATICALARCVGFGGNGAQCETVALSAAGVAAPSVARFKSVALSARMRHPSLVYPMLSDGNMQVVPPSQLDLSPNFRPGSESSTDSPFTMKASGSALMNGTFSFLTAFGSWSVEWPEVCNECNAPGDMCDTAGAKFPPDAPLRKVLLCPGDGFCPPGEACALACRK